MVAPSGSGSGYLETRDISFQFGSGYNRDGPIRNFSFKWFSIYLDEQKPFPICQAASFLLVGLVPGSSGNLSIMSNSKVVEYEDFYQGHICHFLQPFLLMFVFLRLFSCFNIFSFSIYDAYVELWHPNWLQRGKIMNTKVLN